MLKRLAEAIFDKQGVTRISVVSPQESPSSNRTARESQGLTVDQEHLGWRGIGTTKASRFPSSRNRVTS